MASRPPGTVETVESHFNNYKNGRDAYLFFTDNAIVPCKFSLTSVDCSELMESNGVKKLIGGDTVDRLDQLKQLMKIGAKLAEPYAEFTPYGVLALTTYSFASMGIDVLYDEYAIYLSKQRLAQSTRTMRSLPAPAASLATASIVSTPRSAATRAQINPRRPRDEHCASEGGYCAGADGRAVWQRRRKSGERAARCAAYADRQIHERRARPRHHSD